MLTIQGLIWMTWSLVRASLVACSFAAFTTSDIDSRAITRRWQLDWSFDYISSWGEDLITDLSRSEPYELKDNTDLEWEFSADSGVQRLHMVAYGLGAKNILRSIVSFGCKITVVPSTNLSSEVLHLKLDGILFSNEPGGQSAAVPHAVQIVQDLVGKVPGFGICMGHQQLGQALGRSTLKTNFGHHDGNHPVRHRIHLPTGRVEISAQLIRTHCQKLLN